MHLSRTRGLTPEPNEEGAAIAAAAPSPPPSDSGSEHDAAVKPPWRRILYAPQPYPDSYVDHTFLSSLVTNANVVPLSYTSLCLGACTITQRLCLLALWVAAFHAMRTDTVAVQTMLALDGGALLLGMVAMVAVQAQDRKVTHRIGQHTTS